MSSEMDRLAALARSVQPPNAKLQKAIERFEEAKAAFARAADALLAIEPPSGCEKSLADVLARLKRACSM